MPELPEVESVKLQLQQYLVGPTSSKDSAGASHSIEKIDIRHPRIFSGDTKNLLGAKFKKIRRFGKVLVFDLDNGYSLISHIKLTGQFIYRGPKLKVNRRLSKKVVGGLGGRHTHLIFNLDKKGKLYYNDVRRFGWVKIIKTKDVQDFDFIKKLGPEPLDGLTLKHFKEVLSNTRRAIKVVIMDQSKMGGVGNIYANDALFLARVDPKKPANSLTGDEAQKLFKAIEIVLRRGLKYGGASELAFVTPDGSEGHYQEHTLVYGKTGKPCPNNCGGKIEKFALGGRGTYWCPRCQS